MYEAERVLLAHYMAHLAKAQDRNGRKFTARDSEDVREMVRAMSALFDIYEQKGATPDGKLFT
jgi:hypothetical protein